MKVVFLDFDGVLNSLESCRLYGSYQRLSPRAIAALQRILDTTGARIVVSSTWRLSHSVDELRQILREAGLFRFEVVGATPYLHGDLGRGFYQGYPRRTEIQAWLDEHPEVTAWCAIDDDFDAGPDRLVQTKFEHGLLDEHADQVIAMLTPGGSFAGDAKAPEEREAAARRAQERSRE